MNLVLHVSGQVFIMDFKYDYKIKSTKTILFNYLQLQVHQTMLQHLSIMATSLLVLDPYSYQSCSVHLPQAQRKTPTSYALMRKLVLDCLTVIIQVMLESDVKV